MAARLSVEELQPARAARRPRPRGRRRFQGARVERTLRLVPRDAGGIIDLALEGLFARLGPCLAVALVLWIPFRQVAELFGATDEESTIAMFFALGWGLLELVPRAISESVGVSLVVDALEDRRAPPQASIRRGLARSAGVLVVLGITQIALAPLFLLLLVPGVVAQWLTFAAVPIYLVEGEGLLTASERARGRRNPVQWLLNVARRVGRSLARSVRLSWGAPAFGRWLLVIVAQFLLTGSMQIAILGTTYPQAREALRETLGIGGTAAELALGTLAASLVAVTACVQAALRAAYYLDLRVRREGWDLELRLRGAGPATPAEAR